jgi:hypothetical protein
LILIFVFYIVFAFFLAILSPKHFVAFYILSTTKFLGFFDPETLFTFQGIGLGGPTLHIVIFAVVLSKGRVNRMAKVYHFFTLGMIGLFIYGIVKPLIFGLESVVEATMASKEFWAVSFFLYLCKFKDKILIEQFIKLIVPLGVYLSLTYLVNLFFNLAPPFYRPDEVFRASFPTYISLAWFFCYYLFLSKKYKAIYFLLLSAIFFSGLILAGHSAITITSVGFICFFSLVFRGRASISFFTVFRTFLICQLVFFIVMYSDPLYNYLSLVISGEDSALSSRDSYNVFRWEAINDSPMFGYGFVHKNAKINQEYIDVTTNQYTERFQVIDSGYVDILIKFGYIGLALILVIWSKIVVLAFTSSITYNPLRIVCGLYLLQYFLINYTWSVFTHIHGLVPGFIVAFMIIRFAEEQVVSRKSDYLLGI